MTRLFTVRFVENDRGNPPDKLADAELHFTDQAGPLAGCKLIGFAIWQRPGREARVTMPARSYQVNGERRSFALLRPQDDSTQTERITAEIIDAWQAHKLAQQGAYTARTAAPTPEPPKLAAVPQAPRPMPDALASAIAITARPQRVAAFDGFDF